MLNNQDTKHIDRVKTELNACSLETLQNFKGSNKPVMIGCYQLDQETKIRDGQLRLYYCKNGDHDESDIANLSFGKEPATIHQCPGVLDGSWITCYNDEEDRQVNMFASASATGKIYMHEMIEEDCADVDVQQQVSLIPRATSEALVNSTTGENAICLALDCSVSHLASTASQGTAKIVSSYSNGEVAIHDIDMVGMIENDQYHSLVLEETQRIRAHTLFGCPSEVWACCWAKTSTSTSSANCILTGADDCKMKCWDLRAGSSRPVFVVDGEHEAGVTCLSYHPRKENLFASGSYDEGIRLWDIRCMTKPVICDKIDVGGGVWRIKWHPIQDNIMLVACMHGGCRIVKVPTTTTGEISDDGDTSVGTKDESAEIVKAFTEHESMAYGADWVLSSEGGSNGSDGDDEILVSSYKAATCSFYDQQAFLW